MVWIRHTQQQQRGAQLHARNQPSSGSEARKAGEAPVDTVEGREAQEHEHAALDTMGGQGRAGESPASPVENTDGDPATGLRTGNAPSAPESRASWDEAVQPERRRHPRGWDDEPLPEGK